MAPERQRRPTPPPAPEFCRPTPTAEPIAEETAGGDAAVAAICHQLAGVLFPWDITRALELALLKTFCVPSIAELLAGTGEFNSRPRKRYDDTGLMVAELLRHGPDSPAGQAVIARMNRIHSHYAIANDDFLYVLSTFVAEPIRWLERFGWRALTAREQQALFLFWRRVGERMAIADLPASLEQLLAFNHRFEAQRFAAATAGAQVAEATLRMLLSDWPLPLRPGIRRLLTALPEAAVGKSLGWPAAAPRLQSAIRAGLRLRSRVANGWARLQPTRGSRFYSERPTPSYGASFRLEQLGPPPLLPALNRPRRSGQQRRIGLTGGIASGKSSVGRLLAQRGLPVLDADVYAREALAPGSPAAQAVLSRYGEGVRWKGAPGAEAMTIDRAALGRIVFADENERRWLEQLVHPLVRARFEAELADLQQEPTLVLVIPLLFEVGLEELCSEIWLVDCDPEQQLQRLLARDGLDESAGRARLAAQWPLERKRPLAERLIDNRSGPDALAAQVEAALQRRPLTAASAGSAAATGANPSSTIASSSEPTQAPADAPET